jgi:hypothetical protein
MAIDVEPEEGIAMEILPAGAFGVPCGGEIDDPNVAGESEKAGEVDSFEGDLEELEPCTEATVAEEEAAVAGHEFNRAPIVITPTEVATDASAYNLIGEAATVASNTASHVDTVVRPLYDGAMTFQAIRSEEAPEEFSWKVNLEHEQELRLVNSQYAEVDYEGSHVAMGISAVPAHDAVGASVPTELSVEGSIVTLTVKHRAALPTYPVVAGTGWQGGFKTYEIVMPPNETENGEEIDASEFEVQEGAERVTVQVHTTTIGPPVGVTGSDPVATASSGVPTTERPFAFTDCQYEGQGPPGKTPPRGVMSEVLLKAEWNCHRNLDGDGVTWAIMVNGHVHFKYNKWVWVNANQYGCHHWKRAANVNCFRTQTEPTTGHVDLVGFFRTPPKTYYEAAPTVELAHCEIMKGIIFTRPPARSKWGWVIYNPYRTKHWPVPEGESCAFGDHWPF